MIKLSRALLTVSATIGMAMLSNNLLAQTSSSSSSSSTSTSSSGGGRNYGVTHYPCPDDSDGKLIDEQYPYLDPDDYPGSTVVFPGTNTFGGPISSRSSIIHYSNGSGIVDY